MFKEREMANEQSISMTLSYRYTYRLRKVTSIIHSMRNIGEYFRSLIKDPSFVCVFSFWHLNRSNFGNSILFGFVQVGYREMFSEDAFTLH